MNKKITIIIIIVAVLIGLGIGSYLYWDNLKKSQAKTGAEILEKTQETAEKITEEATKAVLPSIQTNPLEDKPDINPADKANPFKNIKTNPFD